ncbi:MAG TPA: tRNA (adenosine(37)-N6)-dimethylallyltransferase MiaA [Oscillospiraceae bacterium]|nr:tRNA (adenosine(37)-N6)-dimethylallyltransferase MiaA [Oscillospiraceae bacterium]HXK78151.1 tRNA (adenosine(37)-N6)-dimethylallyltransferase MiaA [Oscillospiraceae bacterium]
MKKIPVVAVAGPTASGKTALAVEIAKEFGGEIVSCDSMQIYKDLSVGTARPTEEEMQGIPHHLVGFAGLQDDYSVADYVSNAKKAVAEIHARGKVPVVCGGTGLYMDSLLGNIEFSEIKSDPALREELKKYLEEHGPEALHEKLRELDPELAAKLHPNNAGRVIRAIEVCELTGIPMSEHQRRSKEHPAPYETAWIGLCFSDRETLYAHINRRTEEMLKSGLLDEAKLLLERGGSGTVMQAIGYKELFPYLRGEQTLAEALEILKQETRRYAKRQLTWFRRNDEIQWYSVDAYPDAASLREAVFDDLRKKGFGEKA